ncbi:TetR/AcrR family transcriptional regulator [Streptomyces klenkii]|uniref:TetR/AcrR family transcriptional regulator n=1 Tax=Streptomyces klenkii TaxID=1420899 RepID=A0A3B0A3B9_9ACTN|nr:TetR family transcriptional regulator [Streptomyces klenkii]RKN54961.1 TetR/AcrR family transcriptional regulator [Streptomyces klenkii]
MSYDAEATRRRILEAATAEFAEYGLAGARVDRIATAARANKQAIYLYYGSKEKLFGTVVQGTIDELCHAVDMDPCDARVTAERIFDAYLTRPRAVRLMLWEALEVRGGPVADEETRRAAYQELIRELAPDPEARRAVQDWLFTLVGLVAWNFAAPQLARMILDEPDDAAALRRRRARVAEAAARMAPAPLAAR